MLEWVLARDRQAHVLLTKSDKLNRPRRVTRAQGDQRRLARDAAVTAQLFSAHAKQGFEEARSVLANGSTGLRPRLDDDEPEPANRWWTKKSPGGCFAQPPRQTNPAWG